MGVSGRSGCHGPEHRDPKRGRRVAVLVPAPADETLRSVIGWHAGQGKIVGDLIAYNEANA